MASNRYGGPPSPNGDYRKRFSPVNKYPKNYDNFDRNFPGPQRSNSRDYYGDRGNFANL